jgi:hypothetical protein
MSFKKSVRRTVKKYTIYAMAWGWYFWERLRP